MTRIYDNKMNLFCYSFVWNRIKRFKSRIIDLTVRKKKLLWISIPRPPWRNATQPQAIARSFATRLNHSAAHVCTNVQDDKILHDNHRIKAPVHYDLNILSGDQISRCLQRRWSIEPRKVRFQVTDRIVNDDVNLCYYYWCPRDARGQLLPKANVRNNSRPSGLSSATDVDVKVWDEIKLIDRARLRDRARES